MKGRTIGLGGLVVAVVVAAVAAAVGFGGSDGDGDQADAATRNRPPATTKVTRTTLTATETVSGTLGFGDATTVSARSTGAGGTLTWLPAPGTTITRGKPVFTVDAEPVVLLYGQTPPHRTLASGVEGADVKQFEQNLSALGYTGFTVDEEYSGATADAVREWQEDLGVPQTGRVEVSRIVVAPDAIRVADVKASLGGPATGAVFTYTGTVRIVTVDLDVSKQRLVKPGIAATVDLPDGTRVTGTVSSVGTVATTKTTGSGSQAGSSTTIEVVVEVADQARLGDYTAAPVDVTLVADRRENVLTVPVNALVALAEGGYGVQVVEAATTRYVAVTTGMFAGGRVEISGAGIAEGMLVGVPV